MAYNATNTRTSIRELLEGTIGTTRTVTAAMFKYGVHAGLTDMARKASAVQKTTGTHWFDVVLGGLRNHSDTSVAANGSRRLGVVEVRIPIVTAVRSAAEASQRSTDLETIATNADTAIQALHYRNNLRQTSAAAATNIVSGLMVGPGGNGAPEWELTDEDWEAGLIHHEIRGSVILEITQAT